MRRPLVVGNWKMNGTRAVARSLVRGIQQQLDLFIGRGDAVSEVEIAVCPPYVYLHEVSQFSAQGLIGVGAQNVSTAVSGAFTGEVSASMLAELGMRYVIVGHSERRSIFGETEADLLPKLQQVMEQGMVPILCVGESLEQREKGETLAVISAQLEIVEKIGSKAEIVVAYEPVWAIGTGLTASPEQAQEVHAHIRKELGARGESTRLLYGGSANPSNAAGLFAQKDIDGGLIGGASLKVEDFIQVCRAAGPN